MTPTELKAARQALGLTAERFAHLVQVESGRTVRRWEAGDREIPGPVRVLVWLIMSNASVRKFLKLNITPTASNASGP